MHNNYIIKYTIRVEVNLEQLKAIKMLLTGITKLEKKVRNLKGLALFTSHGGVGI